MATIERMPRPKYASHPFRGTTTPITPAITTPSNSAAPISRGRTTKPYSSARRRTLCLPLPVQQASVQCGCAPPPGPLLLRLAQQPYQQAAEQAGEKGDDGPEHGNHRPQQGLSDGDAVDAGLRRGQQE